MTNKNRSFIDFVSGHINDFVELDSYLSSSKLYGVISEYDNLSLTLDTTFVDEKNVRHKDLESLYIPINSIKSIRKL